jgi:HAD superfamily hydrolase (TIGR01549 family)
MAEDRTPVETVVVDVDGTLVDTVYHHTMAWVAAFAAVGVYVPAWRIHRSIGIGGDRLVARVAGDEVEERHGDEVRSRHDRNFEEVIDDIEPLPGAAQLLDALRDRGLKVVLASSGEAKQTERLMSIFDGEDRSLDWTSSGEVESSKPAPDLIEVALQKVGGGSAAVIGDAVWDIAAAEKAGLPSIGLLCGGFSERELLDAGAAAVFETPQELCGSLDRTILAGG